MGAELLMITAELTDRWAGALQTDEDFEAFYLAYRLEALRWLHGKELTWDRAVIEDVAQEAWVAIYNHLAQIEHARAYLYRTLDHKLADERHLRRRRPLGQAALRDVTDPSADPEGTALLPSLLDELEVDLREVLQAIGDLSEPLQNAYRLRVTGPRLCSREVASILGCTISAVDSRVSRARAQLVHQLGKDRLTRFEQAAGRPA
jgi:RNA polymerase sigma factor (sigma-70 family)